MKRRAFIKGAVSAAVAASLPGGDGVALYSAKHPAAPTPALLPFVGDADTGIFSTSGDKLEFVVSGQKMANALAKSMMQSMETVAADVYNRGGSTDETDSDI